MSISTVKAGLDDIAQSIRTEKQAMTNAKARISTGRNNLIALATVHAEIITEIQTYVGTDAFEALSKDELAKLTTEFIALRDGAAAAETALSGITEF